jgi:hypothetical protein
MTTTKLVAVALVSATFGGTVGAMATGVSPQAIAASIQRVADSSAESSLKTINAKLQTEVNAEASTHSLSNQELRYIEGELSTIRRNSYFTCRGSASVYEQSSCSDLRTYIP